MVDPGLRLSKMLKTSKREWIGCLDGMLEGFRKTRGSSPQQATVAILQLVEFIFAASQDTDEVFVIFPLI